MKRVYLAIENLSLDSTQQATLVIALRALGPSAHPQPACLNHWRTRLDNQAGIFEALFATDDISIEAFKKRLGSIFGVSWVTIGHSVNIVEFSALPTAVVTFSRTGTDYIRMAIFGYAGEDWPSWRQSGDECRAYLALHRAEWEVEEL